MIWVRIFAEGFVTLGTSLVFGRQMGLAWFVWFHLAPPPPGVPRKVVRYVKSYVALCFLIPFGWVIGNLWTLVSILW